jgi:16S rRNA (guanine966-N2)-methyltransferase
MRVIAGSARGIRLAAPRGINTRPTADRVREALFSIIQSRCDLKGILVLDVCAGTGGLGIEALSRGAASCCFIENDRNALTCLRQNLSAAHCSGQAQLLEMDVSKALQLLAVRKRRFGMIFFDPPYASELYTTVLEAVCSLSLLDVGGLFITECASRSILPERTGSLVKIDRRVYGDTALELYALEAE